jgi:pimeloyl-ACP methyl ester carboxylesterase
MASNMTLALAHREYGSGPPLVILHGLFGSSRNWHSFARKLGDQYRVFSLDLRNHGDSPWADSVGYEDLAADVERFILSQDLGAPVVIGHSMGGKTAMTLALDHGDLVGGLIVMDISPVPYDHDHDEFIGAMRDMDLSALRNRSDADAVLSKAVPEPGVRQFLLHNLVSAEGGYRWRINLGALAGSMESIMGFPETLTNRAYKGPTLFLYGGRSDYVRLEHQPLIKTLFPQATLETIADAGHWLHAERPDAVRGSVERFLAERVGNTEHGKQ